MQKVQIDHVGLEVLAAKAEEKALLKSHTIYGFNRAYRSMLYHELIEYWNVDQPWQASSVLEPLMIKAGALAYESLINVQRKLLGLAKRSASIDGFNITWLESTKPQQDKPTLFLVHGLSADKDSWLLFASTLVKKYNVVIVDLPAHGETDYLPHKSYVMDAQVNRMYQLLDYLHLDKVHLAGHSMGGFIVTKMALAAPDRILSLCLMSAAGMYPRVHSDLDNSMGLGKNEFITHSLEDYEVFMRMAMYKPLWIPKPIFLMMSKKNSDMRFRIVKCMSDFLPEIFGTQTVTKHIHELTMPILCLWGKHDHIVDVDVMYNIGEILPHAKTIALEKTGHLPLIERPKTTAKLYLNFLAKL